MLNYSHRQTSSIVSRISKIMSAIKLIIILNCYLIIIPFFALIGYGLSRDGGSGLWTGVLILLGLLLGYWVGSIIASFFTLTLEWMAQLVVATGEIINEIKKVRDPNYSIEKEDEDDEDESDDE
mgnify:CR=1 FL=1